jgi:hypothetical protein
VVLNIIDVGTAHNKGSYIYNQMERKKRMNTEQYSNLVSAEGRNGDIHIIAYDTTLLETAKDQYPEVTDWLRSDSCIKDNFPSIVDFTDCDMDDDFDSLGYHIDVD